MPQSTAQKKAEAEKKAAAAKKRDAENAGLDDEEKMDTGDDGNPIFSNLTAAVNSGMDKAKEAKDDLTNSTDASSHKIGAGLTDLDECTQDIISKWQEVLDEGSDNEVECDPVKACIAKCRQLQKDRARVCAIKRKALQKQLKELACSGGGKVCGRGKSSSSSVVSRRSRRSKAKSVCSLRRKKGCGCG